MRDGSSGVERLVAALAMPRELFQAGRVAEAEEALRGLLDQYAGTDDPELAAEVYRAKVSHALLLAALDRQPEAVEGLRRMVAAQGPVGRSRDMDRAWFYATKRLVEMDEGPTDLAENLRRTTAAIDAAVRRFGPLADPEIDRGLAELLHLAANAWLNVGDEDEALRVLVHEIIERWSDPTDEHLAWWVTIAQVRAALIFRVRLPIRLIGSNPESAAADDRRVETAVFFPWLNMERRHALRNAERALAGLSDRKRIKAVRRELGCSLKAFDDTLDAAVDAHNDAVKIVDAYRYQAEPFAVYLRNFEADEYYALVPAKDPDDLPNTYFATSALSERTSDDDGAIIRALRTFVPTVTTTNTYGGTLDLTLRSPRLIMTDTTWRDTVSVLVAAAELVVLRIVLLTPGVRDELDLIRRRAREANTVVLLSRLDEQRHKLDFFSLQKEAFRLRNPTPEIIDIDSPLLDGLRVVYDDEIYDPRTDVSVFDEHIREFRRLAAMHPLDRFDALSGRLVAPPTEAG